MNVSRLLVLIAVIYAGTASATQERPRQPKAARRPAPVDPIEQAILDGQPLRGMSPGQVRRAMAGSPERILRSASSRSINEVWIFGRAGRLRTVVHFVRQRGQLRSESRVTSVARFRP